jgi:hypothetical protein
MYHHTNALRTSGFAVFALKPEFRPVLDAPPLWPTDLNGFGIKSYYFKINDKDTPEEAKWVTILPYGSPPTAGTIHIYETEKKIWVSFSDWLRQACASQEWVGKKGYDKLFNWWKYTGPSRRFEDFPHELQDKIYTYALGGEVYPLSTLNWLQVINPAARANACLALGRGYHRGLFSNNLVQLETHLPEARPFIFEPNLALLRTSSWIRDEMLHVGWVLMRARFFDPETFHAAIDARAGTAMSYNPLRKIELNFTNRAWFDFFGVEMLPYYRAHRINATRSLGRRLQAHPYLKDLQLHFRPLDDGWKGGPWGNLYQGWASGQYICCQRTMVDWISTFAYPFLIDKCKAEKLKVRLTGAVKTDTKKKWEAIFRGKRENDQNAAMAAILSTSDGDI